MITDSCVSRLSCAFAASAAAATAATAGFRLPGSHALLITQPARVRLLLPQLVRRPLRGAQRSRWSAAPCSNRCGRAAVGSCKKGLLERGLVEYDGR
jgi:hypothetical protein